MYICAHLPVPACTLSVSTCGVIPAVSGMRECLHGKSLRVSTLLT